MVVNSAMEQSGEKNGKAVIFGLVVIVCIWSVVFWQGLITAIDIWIMSDIFNHCLFVLPAVGFFIYLKRPQLAPYEIVPNYWLLLPCIGSLLLYAIGLSGGVQLFMHVATFTFLPLSIWLFLGNKLAAKITFPLFFILFCIPIGEELIPTLQQITADMSVVMLNWSGVPIFRTGLYIEIPEGRFLVAEACSGISFFIASIVIGSLYAYLNIQSATRKILFMTIAILFPVLANAIRVFGIILTGHLTNMEHAVGADHLIYGWIFFSFVIICLIAIGELIREKTADLKVETVTTGSGKSLPPKVLFTPVGILLILTLSFAAWYQVILTQLAPVTAPHKINRVAMFEPTTAGQLAANWSPEFKNAYDAEQGTFTHKNKLIDMYVAWYPKGEGELISSLNRFYLEGSWTLDSRDNFTGPQGLTFAIEQIVNSQSRRLLTHWYVVDGKVLTDKKMAKLYEIYRIMRGDHIGSGIIILSKQSDNISIEQDSADFKNMLADNFEQLNASFPL
ncbi:MAG: exosortase A [Paraglaciecola sp.]|jgi:exosortase A